MKRVPIEEDLSQDFGQSSPTARYNSTDTLLAYQLQNNLTNDIIPKEVSSKSESKSKFSDLLEEQELTFVANLQVGEYWFFIGIGQEGN